MDLYESEKQDYQTTPPLYPPEDPDAKLKSPLQPHRRSADQNIFNHNKGEVGSLIAAALFNPFTFGYERVKGRLVQNFSINSNFNLVGRY